MLYYRTNSLKMEGLLETCSNVEVPSVIRFFCVSGEGVVMVEIYRHLVEVYGARVLYWK